MTESPSQRMGERISRQLAEPFDRVKCLCACVTSSTRNNKPLWPPRKTPLALLTLPEWSHNINAFSFRVYPIFRSRSFFWPLCFSLITTSMTAVFCCMYSMSELTEIPTLVRNRGHVSIENGDRHCRMLNSVCLGEGDGDGFSTFQQVYPLSPVFLYSTRIFFRIFPLRPCFIHSQDYTIMI